jgi:hypothetical protein
VKEKAFKASITNSKVLEKVQEIKASHKSELLEKENKILNKLEAASKRKVRKHCIFIVTINVMRVLPNHNIFIKIGPIA